MFLCIMFFNRKMTSKQPERILMTVKGPQQIDQRHTRKVTRLQNLTTTAISKRLNGKRVLQATTRFPIMDKTLL